MIKYLCLYYKIVKFNTISNNVAFVNKEVNKPINVLLVITNT